MPEPLPLHGTRPLIMGILNVTPDSFSDGGEFMDRSASQAHATRMISEGADIIDVGGESTRPGAEPVPASEQIRRTQPVVAAIRASFPAVHISIDTRLAEVAEEAGAAGATVVNDITALRGDERMAEVVADAGAAVVLMHMQGTPQDMQRRPQYEDVVGEIEHFLVQRIDHAVRCGIKRGRVVVDPGIGFGKSVAHNLEILRHLDRFNRLGPVLIGVSRKSFLAAVLGTSCPGKAETGTTVANTIALMAGARILRVHDVGNARQAVDLVHAVRDPGSRSESPPA